MNVKKKAALLELVVKFILVLAAGVFGFNTADTVQSTIEEVQAIRSNLDEIAR